MRLQSPKAAAGSDSTNLLNQRMRMVVPSGLIALGVFVLIITAWVDVSAGTQYTLLLTGVLAALTGILLWAWRLTQGTTDPDAFASPELLACTEYAPIGVFIQDLNGRFSYVNERLVQMVGRAIEESPLASVNDVMFEVGSGSKTGDSRCSGVVQPPMTVRVTRDDGTFVRLEVHRTLVGVGGVAQIIGTALDVTDRSEAERTLKWAEASYRNIFYNSPNPKFILDESGCIVRVNRAGTSILGLGLEDDPKGRFVGEFIAEDDIMRAADAIGKAVAGHHIEASLFFQRGGIQDREVLASFSPLPNPDGGHWALAVCRDVTGERRACERAMRAERLATLGTLLGGVSHELNNPLHAIRGLADLLLSGAGDEEDIRQIAKEAKRASSIVGEMLRQTRRAGTQTSEFARLSVNSLLNEVLDGNLVATRPYGIEVRRELAADLPDIAGSSSQMSQVIINLVQNAVQAMASVDRPKVLSIKTRVADGGIELEIGDTGTGIAESQRSRIFDPFFTTKREGQGTGLGLSVVQGIVREHGGMITVRSKLDIGTRFVVWLPTADDASVGADSEDDAVDTQVIGLGNHQLRILLADDEAGIRMAFGRYLRLRGHHVTEAEDGETLLRLLDQGESFDVVVSDLWMPGMTAEALLQQVEERHPDHFRKMLVMTGGSASPEVRSLIARFERPYLFKPFSSEHGSAAVEAVANQASALPA